MMVAEVRDHRVDGLGTRLERLALARGERVSADAIPPGLLWTCSGPMTQRVYFWEWARDASWLYGRLHDADRDGDGVAWRPTADGIEVLLVHKDALNLEGAPLEMEKAAQDPIIHAKLGGMNLQHVIGTLVDAGRQAEGQLERREGAQHVSGIAERRHAIDAGDKVRDRATEGSPGEVVAVDDSEGTIDRKRGVHEERLITMTQPLSYGGFRFYQSRCREPVHHWHAQIHQHKVRLHLAVLLQRLLAIRRFCDHLESGLGRQE